VHLHGNPFCFEEMLQVQCVDLFKIGIYFFHLLDHLTQKYKNVTVFLNGDRFHSTRQMKGSCGLLFRGNLVILVYCGAGFGNIHSNAFLLEFRNNVSGNFHNS